MRGIIIFYLKRKKQNAELRDGESLSQMLVK